jgi:glutathione synthase/RimK-type ligase-like ATP-grasp enzyme
MTTLIVVEDPSRWRFDFPGTELVTPQSYLTQARFMDLKRSRVYNMCRSNGYQTVGYYVSLLAAARGHRPLPSVTTLQDLKLASVVRLAAAEVEPSAAKLLAPLKTETFEISIYFGRNVAKRYDPLCQAIFARFPAPLLRAEFRRDADGWRLTAVRPIAPAEIPEHHSEFVVEQGRKFFSRPQISNARPARYSMAILVEPDEVDAPSDAKALARFQRAADRLGVQVTMIDKEDYARVAEFDALFIRVTTAVNHYSYRFARRAAAEGVVVIDDPESIVKCTNKVYQAELFRRHGVATPKTLVVHRGNATQVITELGLPCVIKQPDSAFSAGVVKAKTPEELDTVLKQMLAKSELAVAQAYLPSEFDWRVGVMDGKPLYVCRYYMARGHWQIQRATDATKRVYGRSDTLPLEEAPAEVVALAVRAANLVGNSLYGVDIKEIDGIPMVIEVNDNPSIDAGCEDLIAKDALYDTILLSIINRIEARGGPVGGTSATTKELA